MAGSHIPSIRFRIPGAVEPDEYAVRAYADERLGDAALMGPDENGIFDAEFEREAESLRVAFESAVADLEAVFPRAEILSAPPIR